MNVNPSNFRHKGFDEWFAEAEEVAKMMGHKIESEDSILCWYEDGYSPSYAVGEDMLD